MTFPADTPIPSNHWEARVISVSHKKLKFAKTPLKQERNNKKNKECHRRLGVRKILRG